MEQDLLQGKVAIITGGSSGMGKDMAFYFARLGASVMICGRSMERLRPVVEEITSLGGKAQAYECDVRNPEMVQSMVNETVQTWGGIDILVNNAAGNFVCRAEDLSVNGWNAVENIVLNGTWYCSQAVGKQMIAAGKGGAMLNIVASYAWTGGPGVVHSASAKAGIIAMSRTLASEWGKYGIRINCLAPGPIEGTGGIEKLMANEQMKEAVIDNVALKRLGTKEEISSVAAFLVSRYTSYITGDVITVDGGSWLDKGFLHQWERTGAM